MDGGIAGKRDKHAPARLLEQAIDLFLEVIEDGKQRLDEASSTTEWVKLAGALGQAQTRMAQLVSLKAKSGGEASEIELALMQAIREWHGRNSPNCAASVEGNQQDLAIVNEET
ncbi:MAG: hypothetical protein R6V73_13810 [Anaerolineales bacterium]|jgi:hypothetical protein